MKPALTLALLALSGAAAFAQPLTPPAPPPRPFEVNRGSAPPPPAYARGEASAPAEGVGPGGIDFGRWRSAEPEAYGAAFQGQMQARFAGRSVADARVDLMANGFTCSDQAIMQCRIEITDAGCAKDWYVVFEPRRPEPIAGFDAMCLGR
jgi:hypothetical protein